MWWRTLLLVLLTALHTRADDESQLQVGKSINIFSRYGYLSLSMKVVSRNDTDWVFREPTLDIFTDLDSLTSRPKRVAKKGFQGDFYVEFCDDLDQLFQAYFREFTFERLNKPWKAFTASWSKETVAKSMGINSSFVQGEYCYALVRLSRFRDSVALSSLPRNIRLAQTVSEEIDGIRIGDVYSVFRFIQKFGTHYINSFVTGNSLYQVFVYTPSVYRNLKNLVKQRGLSNLATPELANYFGPWQAEHMGSIKAASGNKTIESWAAQRLRLHHYIFTYPSLFKIRGDGQLMRYLNEILGDEAILEMNMRTVAPAFKDPAKRKWFNEVLDNYMSLWDVNL